MSTSSQLKVGLLSMGCARTLVDSEVALGGLIKHGYGYTPQVEQADVAIINTCGFTDEAKQESIEAILRLAELKKKNQIQALVIMGCLSQRFPAELKAEIPEADAIIGTNSFADLARKLEPLKQRKQVLDVEPRPNFLLNAKSPRYRLTPRHYVYIKISEGCINACSYCAIPRMKGKHRSRPVDDILAEVAALKRQHPLSEINLIAQDAAAYGYDLERNFLLARLLKELAQLVPKTWIRPLYLHPAHVTPDLMDVMRDFPNICRYVDLPIEHAHPDMLQRMNRGCTYDQMDGVVKAMRSIPDMILRTAVIVGFPGETEAEHQFLLDYMREVKFERLGAFKFSREEGTRAYDMPNQIAPEVIQKRFDEVMSLQRKISSVWNQTRVGQTLRVLVDEATPHLGENIYTARSQADAPEVDGQVILHAKRKLKAGEFVDAKITDALDYDLVAETCA